MRAAATNTASAQRSTVIIVMTSSFEVATAGIGGSTVSGRIHHGPPFRGPCYRRRSDEAGVHWLHDAAQSRRPTAGARHGGFAGPRQDLRGSEGPAVCLVARI